MASRKRRPRPARRSRKPAQPASAEFDPALSIVRVVIGAASLGADEVLGRLRSHPGGAKDGHPGERTPAERPLGIGDLSAGLAVECVLIARRVGAAATSRSRTAGSGLNRLARVPGVSLVARPLRRRYRRLENEMTRLAERGRLEQVRSRGMVADLLRDTTSRSFSDVAQFAVREVTHNPDVAAMVRTESTGLATDTILEVRAKSEQADDRIERKVHSWLRRRQSDARSGADRVDAAGA